jgi:thioredoxin reductase/Pyruvate/2-oxoacid:ferredoxin oxidoreductase delta subunit
VSSKEPLYVAGLSDPRERDAQPRERSARRRPRLEGPTSDVTRFRGVVAAAVAGALTTVTAALALPEPGGARGAPGPLSRPHALAGLPCDACHGAKAERASDSCTRCHGAHGSVRRGHAAALASGALTCASCHPIHVSDQGVSLSQDGRALRFAPGVEAEIARTGSACPEGAGCFRPASRDAVITVAIPSAGSCARCHDLAAPRDPIARCLLGGQEALGDARPIVCFDEHARALPGAARTARPAQGSAVCAAQHTEDRAIAWEAAREAAAAMPVVRRGGNARAPAGWLGAGLLVAGLVLGGVRGSDAWKRRRREAKARLAVPEAAPRVRLPQIDTATCLGCYACVDACPYDVLEVERYVAVVARPEACCGLTLCEQRCPNGSLRITDGEAIGDRPRVDAELQSLDVPGLYLAGDVTGLPLIKNAILQGARAVERIAESLGQTKALGEIFDRAPERAALDLLIIGAGPAGISAALRARELGLSFHVIEQGSVAQSIRSFPRGKLVFDQPLELPVTGKLWLRESTKEELLLHWTRIVRQNELPIREDTRVTDLVRDASSGVFRVSFEEREGGAKGAMLARRVLLAIGQRGSPRRLPVPLSPEVEARVHYHLSDARSFEQKRVIVVGLGDVAMEAAVALARQPNTAVTMVHRGAGFSRGKARNVAELKRLVDAGRIGLRLSTEITAISAEQVTVRGPTGDASLGYDAVLVMIGSIPPKEALRAAGVRTIGECALAP